MLAFIFNSLEQKRLLYHTKDTPVTSCLDVIEVFSIACEGRISVTLDRRYLAVFELYILKAEQKK